MIIAFVLALSCTGAAHAARSGGRVSSSRFSSYSSSSSTSSGRSSIGGGSSSRSSFGGGSSSRSSFGSSFGGGSSSRSSFGSSFGGGSSSHSTFSLSSLFQSHTAAPSLGSSNTVVVVTPHATPTNSAPVVLAPPSARGTYKVAAASTTPVPAADQEVLQEAVKLLVMGSGVVLLVWLVLTFLEVPGSCQPVSVARVLVALLGTARQLQHDLDRMAARTDISSSSGMSHVLQETVLALQRHPDYWLYGAGNVSIERGTHSAEASFNRLSLEGRSKFNEETLSNVGGSIVKKPLGKNQQQQGTGNHMIVVTLLVAAAALPGGKPLQLPKHVRSRDDMHAALNELGALPDTSLVGVEVLWSPQDSDDYLTQDEVLADFPSMAAL